eukprot:Hpha_TRINITY_DN5683_c0_g1::TRINITY_DN5683_c0_g1_i1::g.50688::m.50688/K04097/HPGDS; prostaglandin-H2 D-isomerase / glutathione transferase
MPKVALTYFNIQGVAEKVRLALKVSGVEFEDVRVKMDEWQAMKPKTKYGQLPLLEIDGKEYAQSGAMLRWAGKLGDGSLYPSDAESVLRIEEVMGLADDMQREWTPAFYMGLKPAKMGHYDITDEAKAGLIKRMRTEFAEEALPRYLGHFTKFIEQNGGKFLAGELSIADLQVLPFFARFASGDLDHIPADSLEKFPAVTQWMERVRAVPAIAEWYSQKH